MEFILKGTLTKNHQIFVINILENLDLIPTLGLHDREKGDIIFIKGIDLIAKKQINLKDIDQSNIFAGFCQGISQK